MNLYNAIASYIEHEHYPNILLPLDNIFPLLFHHNYNSYWQDFNAFQIKLQTFHNERDSVNLKYDHDARQLERLQKTNVYKDTFCISHEGHFGTINGFRLGRLPTQPVCFKMGGMGG